MPGSTQDLLLYGGRIYPSFPSAMSTAVGISGGKVVATGTDDEVRAALAPGVHEVDLDGRTVVPGFVDAHLHPVMAGMMESQCNIDDCESLDEALTRIGDYAANHPDRPWVTGSGWHMPWFPGGTPSAELLDTVVRDRPAMLFNADGHGAWVNTAALHKAGIDRHTPDPQYGRIERLPDGTPQGTLHEGAMDLAADVMPTPAPEEIMDGLLRGQAHLHSLGITGWQDAIVGKYATLHDSLQTYIEANRTSRLTGRVTGALWWDRGRGLEQLDDLLKRRKSADPADPANARSDGCANRFKATSVKVMQDGVAENQTAGMISPYLDVCGCQTENSGLSYVDPVELREIVSQLDLHNFQVHFHALGDRAVREALDALEFAANTTIQSRAERPLHHLAHLQVVNPADIPRFGRLRATANIQALWACHEPQLDDLTLPFLGSERADQHYPFRSLLSSGARLCAGSDWPVSSANPLLAAYVATTRENPDVPGNPLIPRERLGVEEFLSAYTAGSARINGLDRSGTLESGQYADLAILDGDPLGSADLRNIGVTTTLVEGEVVHGSF